MIETKRTKHILRPIQVKKSGLKTTTSDSLLHIRLQWRVTYHTYYHKISFLFYFVTEEACYLDREKTENPFTKFSFELGVTVVHPFGHWRIGPSLSLNSQRIKCRTKTCEIKRDKCNNQTNKYTTIEGSYIYGLRTTTNVLRLPRSWWYLHGVIESTTTGEKKA